MLQAPSTFVAASGGSAAMTAVSMLDKANGEVLNRAQAMFGRADKEGFQPGETAIRGRAMWDTLVQQFKLYGKMTTPEGRGDVALQMKMYGEHPGEVGTPFNPTQPLQGMYAAGMNVFRYGSYVLGLKRTFFRVLN